MENRKTVSAEYLGAGGGAGGAADAGASDRFSIVPTAIASTFSLQL